MNCVKVDIKNKRTVYVTEEIPTIEKDTDVIIAIKAAGFCGTDLHVIHGKFEAKDGVVLGHEMAGVIVKISPKYSHLAVGDKVTVNPNICCGICDQCKKELFNFCKMGGITHALGLGINGAWAQYCRAHVSLVEKLSDGVTFEQGALCEPLSCIIHGLDKASNIKIGSEIAIVGAGIIGLLWSCVLHLMGHKRVYVIEPNENRRSTVEKLGLGYNCWSPEEFAIYQKENPSWKIDLCVDCSGNVKAMQSMIPSLANGASFLIFGVSAPEHTLTLSPYELFRKEITIKGITINTPNSFKTAVAFIESMKDKYLQIEKLGIKKYPLKNHQDAVEAFSSGLYNKIMFEI